MRVLLISYGPQTVLSQQVMRDNELFSGVVSCYRHMAQALWDIQHWRNAQGSWGQALFSFNPLQLPWQLEGAPLAINALDSRECYLEQEALWGAPALNEHWHLCASRQQLMDQALHSLEASIVFALSRNEQIDALADCIAQLRRAGVCGKIVVRELEPCLRYRDERLLSACGMTVRISYEVSHSSFISWVEALRTLQAVPYVDVDVAALKSQLAAPAVRGVVSGAEFIAHVAAVQAKSAALMSHQLLAFNLRQGLSVEQCLGHLRLRRMGDLACVAGQTLYVFLFGCRADTLLGALKNTFELPWTTLFSQYQVLASIDDIEHHAQLVNAHRVTAARSTPNAVRQRPQRAPLLGINCP